MARDDWAIVVGIRSYPVLGDLDGPGNDSQAFRDWLASPAGGDVPAAQIELIQSPAAPLLNVLGATPARDQVNGAFERLMQLSDQNVDAGKGARIGRRLYVYMAGHGFEPEPEIPALLMANATKRNFPHLPGKPYIDWFRRAGFFDEFVLFMDCCREVVGQVPLARPAVVPPLGAKVQNPAWLVGYPTKPTKRSREKPINGKARGVFTTALIAGLEGAAVEVGGTRVTATSLKTFLYDHMRDWLDPIELADKDIPKTPDVQFEEAFPGQLVLATPGQMSFEVHVRPPPGATRLTIFDGKFQTVLNQPLGGQAITTKLEKGLYLAEVMPSGAKKPFGVPETGTQGGTTHVDF